MGLQTVGASTSTLGDGYLVGQTYVAPGSGATIDMRLYLTGGASTSRIMPCVYNTSGLTAPTTPVGAGSQYTIAIGQAAGWVTLTMSGLSIVSGTRYWIGYQSDNPAGGGQIAYNTTGADGVYGQWTNGGTFGTLPSSWPINANHGTQAFEFSVYLELS